VFCNVSKPIGERAFDVISQMTLAEKVGQVGSNGVSAIDRLNIPAYEWWGEALHGVVRASQRSDTTWATTQ
jgi:beta-glucosidase